MRLRSLHVDDLIVYMALSTPVTLIGKYQTDVHWLSLTASVIELVCVEHIKKVLSLCLATL